MNIFYSCSVNISFNSSDCCWRFVISELLLSTILFGNPLYLSILKKIRFDLTTENRLVRKLEKKIDSRLRLMWNIVATNVVHVRSYRTNHLIDITQWPNIFVIFSSSKPDPYRCLFYNKSTYMLSHFPSLNQHLPSVKTM